MKSAPVRIMQRWTPLLFIIIAGVASMGGNRIAAQSPIAGFDVCLEDDASANFLLFSSATGQYEFRQCDAGGFTLTGTGIAIPFSPFAQLKEIRPDRVVKAQFDPVKQSGRAAVQYQGKTYLINDSDTRNNTCVCPPPVTFSVSASPIDPLLLRASVADGLLVEYFGTKDSNGLATSLTSVTVTNSFGEATSYVLDSQGRPVQIFAFNGVKFLLSWQTETSYLLTAELPDAAAQLTIAVDLLNQTANVIPQTAPKPSRSSDASKAARMRVGADKLTKPSISTADANQICERIAKVFEVGCIGLSGLRLSGVAVPALVCPLFIALSPAAVAACKVAFVGIAWVCFADSLRRSIKGQSLVEYLCQRIVQVFTQPGFNDDFNDGSLNQNLWFVLNQSAGTVVEVNQRLEIRLGPGAVGTGLGSNYKLAGDFDVQIDYTLLNWPSENLHSLRLGVGELGVGPGGGVGLNRSSFPNSIVGSNEFYLLALPGGKPQIASAHFSGTLRLVREGSILSGYIRDGSNWQQVGSGPVSTAPTALNLDLGGGDAGALGGVKAAFDNFRLNAGTIQP